MLSIPLKSVVTPNTDAIDSAVVTFERKRNEAMTHRQVMGPGMEMDAMVMRGARWD